MKDVTIHLTDEKEAEVELLRLQRLLVPLPQVEPGEPQPPTVPLTDVEFCQAVVYRYLDGKTQARERRALRKLSPEETETILEMRRAARAAEPEQE